MDLGWLDSIALDDPVAAAKAAALQLQQLTTDGKARLDYLVALDNAMQPRWKALAEAYAVARRLSAEEDAVMWEAARELHDRFASSWASSLRDVVDKKLALSNAPAIITRIMHHRGRTALWLHLRYVPIPGNWWPDTHKLYGLAEREKLSTRDVILNGQTSSCAAQYLQILLLDTLNRTNMTRQHIQQIDDWLGRHTHNIPIEQSFDENRQLFFVNLNEDRGGRRIRNMEASNSCRYWQTDGLVKEIEQAMAAAESNRPANDTLDLDILHQMHAEWSRTEYKRQRRTDERSGVSKHASVAHGIYAVCQEVRSQALGSFNQKLEGEVWEIENESRYGFGALVSTELNNWLKVGRLIALREEMNLGMSMVGVARSLKHESDDKVYVGVEVFSHMALYGLLHEYPGTGSQPFPGIFLPSDEERNLPTSLLIPNIEYQPQMELGLKIDRRVRHIKVTDLMEQKDDWCRVAIEVLGDLS